MVSGVRLHTQVLNGSYRVAEIGDMFVGHRVRCQDRETRMDWMVERPIKIR